MATVGTLWVDVRFNTDDLARKLGAGLGAAGAGAGAALEGSLSARLTRIGSSAANAGRQISLGLGLPIAALGKHAADAFIGFDTAMTQISSLVGVNRAQVEVWRGDVRKLGTTYGISATEAAQALYFITSSGIAAADAMTVLEVAAKGSAVGLGTAKVVADAVTSAVNAYGQENLSAAKAGDILTVAVREGKGEADKMGGALASVIPIASSLHVGFGEVAGAMSAMTLSGTSADEAATQIRGILNTLQDMPPIAQRALKAQTGLDYATVRQNISSKGLIPTLKEITDAFKGNEAATAEVFGNVRALTGVSNLFGEKEKQTTDIVRQATAAQGDLNRAFEETSQSAAFKLKQAQSEIDSAMVDIGASVVPVFSQVARSTAFVLRGFEGLPPAAKTGVIAMASLAAGAGPLLYMFGSATRLAGLLTGPLSGAFTNLGARLLDMTNRTGTVSRGLGEVGLRAHAAASAIAGPLVAAAAAAVVSLSLINAKLNENEAAFTALAERGKAKNLNVESWDALQARIAKANVGIETTRTELDALNAKGGSKLGPIDLGAAYDRKQLRDAGAVYQTTAEDAAKLAGQAQAVATKFQLTNDAALAWVIAQKALDPELKTSEDAVKAYTRAVANNDPSVAKAASQTALTAGTFSGLIAKVQATSDAFFGLTKAEDAYKAAQKNIADARLKVTDAEKDYADAVRQTAAAGRRVEDADRRLVDSGKRLSEARLAAADAQKALNDALAGPSADESINLDSAKLSLREARKTLADIGKTKPGEKRVAVDPMERERAQLAVRRAEQDLKKTQAEHDERVAGARKDVASATDAVTGAEAAQRDAAQGVIDAQFAKNDAIAKEATARDAIKTAQDGVAAAEVAAIGPAIQLADAQNILNVMLETGTAKSREFRDYLQRLKEKYPELAAQLDPLIEKYRELDRVSGVPDPYGGARPPSDRIEQGPAPAPAAGNAGPNKYQPFGQTRAFGGALTAGQGSMVNERGMPELWTQGGEQYLIPVFGGKVTPLLPANIPVKGGDGGTGDFNIGDINVYEVSGKPRQTAYEVRRELHKTSYLSGRRR